MHDRGNWTPYPNLLPSEGRRIAWIGFLLLWTVLPQSSPGKSLEGEVAQGWTNRTVKFSQSAPYGSPAEIGRHCGLRFEATAYSITNESFQVILPQTLNTNDTFGLLVWISPGDEARIPHPWEEILASQKVIFVGANRSGNDRAILDRIRLALDATCNICRQYRVDRHRIWIGGFSGGGRVASILGVAYGDLYTGALCMSGVNFYQHVRSAEGSAYYPSTYSPQPGILAKAKSEGRVVLVAGEQDFNRDNSRETFEYGFQLNGFKHVRYIEVPGMKHRLPDASVLKEALDYLAGREPFLSRNS